MEVFKINHICKNQLESQFTISYNKGFKVYDLNKLSEISCSNTQDNTGNILVFIFNLGRSISNRYVL
jgi:hypothetical protein